MLVLQLGTLLGLNLLLAHEPNHEWDGDEREHGPGDEHAKVAAKVVLGVEDDRPHALTEVVYREAESVFVKLSKEKYQYNVSNKMEEDAPLAEARLAERTPTRWRR